MKAILKQMLADVMESWNEEADDIYAVSLWVENVEDNLCHPFVGVGYNTERHLQEVLREEHDQYYAKWHFTNWKCSICADNLAFVFGEEGPTQEVLEKWVVEELGLPYYTEAQLREAGLLTITDEEEEEMRKVSIAFVRCLVEIVRELHNEGFIRRVFHREIPVIIHENEYAFFDYDNEEATTTTLEVPAVNEEANGEILPKEFIDYCTGVYQYSG